MITSSYNISVDNHGDFYLCLPHTNPRTANRILKVSTITDMPVAHAIEVMKLGVSEESNAILSNYFPYGKTIAD